MRHVCDTTYGIMLVCKFCNTKRIIHKCAKHKPKISKKCLVCGKTDWIETGK